MILPDARTRFDRHSVCDRCFRAHEECFCGKLVRLNNRVRVVVLQHPQEQLKVLNSARLTVLTLTNALIRVGLSWRNFAGATAVNDPPSTWGVLYLKGGRLETKKPCEIVNKHGVPVEDLQELRGLVAIDGSWKQAKTLWWRNPWLLKLNRITLNPEHPSLRPQSKRAGLSTIEAVAFALEMMGEDTAIPHSLRAQYSALILKSATDSKPHDSADESPTRQDGDC